MKKFKIKLRGYDCEEVDEYLSKTIARAENKLGEQLERIDQLKSENESMRREIKAYRERERSISSALAAATEKAEEIESAAKVRYSLEVQRLKRFQESWTDYYDKIKKEYPLSEEVKGFSALLEDVEKELSNVMEHELNMTVGEGAEKYAEYLKEKYKDEPTDDGFDMAEALTPKQTLSELCKELGLIDD